MNRRDLLNTAAGLGAAALAGETAGAAKQKAPRIKITAIEPMVIRGRTSFFNNPPWTWTRVRTDQGLTGYGECYTTRRKPGKPTIPDLIRGIAKPLVGSDAIAIEAFRQRFWKPEADIEWFCALSSIEIAMWDILGQVAGLPVHALLGGKVRDRIPLYANHSVFRTRDTASRAEDAAQVREMGFKMFKWDPFRKGGAPAAAEIEKEVKEARTIFDALGPDMKVAFDAHGRYTSVESAITAAKLLEPFNPVFFEEPTKRERPDLMPKVAAGTSIPLATGEIHRTVEEAKEWLDTGVVKYLQPDSGNDGGIQETFQIAALANTYGAQMAPHGWAGPVAVRATTHVCAVIPNLLVQEFPGTRPDQCWTQELIDPAPEIVDGELVVPDGPGLGFKVDEKEIERLRIE